MTINLELREVGRSGGLASAMSWIGGDKASDCWLLSCLRRANVWLNFKAAI